jgi:hypothetical protein
MEEDFNMTNRNFKITKISAPLWGGLGEVYA